MFTLIKGVDIYSPSFLGKNDLLICDSKIVKIAKHIDFEGCTIINKEGMLLIPGFIDQHIHITGGGGEGGFHTRTPEVMLSSLIKGGVTCVVGMLGTDSVTRSIESLVAKTKALRNEGISAYCLTGAYSYPSPTITGSIAKDIIFIDEIIGLKIALSDHRESYITKEEMKALVGRIRTASLISKKPGIVTIHLGDGILGFEMIFDILKESNIPIWHFRPTHVNRSEKLWKDACSFLDMGGRIDLTVGTNLDKTLTSLNDLKEKNLENVTFSSDGNGSYSEYDENGKLLEIGASKCDGIYQTVKYLIQNGYKIEDAISFGTENVAKGLYLEEKKGFIKEGWDADIVILDKDFEIDTVIVKGKVMMNDKEMLVKGTFE